MFKTCLCAVFPFLLPTTFAIGQLGHVRDLYYNRDVATTGDSNGDYPFVQATFRCTVEVLNVSGDKYFQLKLLDGSGNVISNPTTSSVLVAGGTTESLPASISFAPPNDNWAPPAYISVVMGTVTPQIEFQEILRLSVSDMINAVAISKPPTLSEHLPSGTDIRDVGEFAVSWRQDPAYPETNDDLMAYLTGNPRRQLGNAICTKWSSSFGIEHRPFYVFPEDCSMGGDDEYYSYSISIGVPNADGTLTSEIDSAGEQIPVN